MKDDTGELCPRLENTCGLSRGYHNTTWKYSYLIGGGRGGTWNFRNQGKKVRQRKAVTGINENDRLEALDSFKYKD